ncbi:MAG TPA: hypothetical protein VLA24_09945 [Pseudomonadales bacterium]|nr:hypothetical protein [Pseudomonadales bacterium]
MKPIAISPYMANIDQRIVDAQRMVMDTLAPDLMFVQALTDKPHGVTVDKLLWDAYKAGYDTALLMDIDAIPLNPQAVDYTLYRASIGNIIGNAQRSNHINNDQHLFVAPSFMGIRLQDWVNCGKPSFAETARGDVAEEVTYAAEAKGYPIQMYLPIRFDAKPAECDSWKLRDGMPVYGCCTTFGIQEFPVSYHAFQIRYQRNVDLFLAKCEEVIQAHS